MKRTLILLIIILNFSKCNQNKGDEIILYFTHNGNHIYQSKDLVISNKTSIIPATSSSFVKPLKIIDDFDNLSSLVDTIEKRYSNIKDDSIGILIFITVNDKSFKCLIPMNEFAEFIDYLNKAPLNEVNTNTIMQWIKATTEILNLNQKYP